MGRTKHKNQTLSALANNLRRLRRAAGLTQEELGRMAKLDRATIAAIERDRYKSTETTTVEALAKGLGVSPAELLLEPVGQASGESFMEEFLASPWSKALEIKQDEIQWIRTLPKITWAGTRPTPEVLAKLILWRRENVS